MQWWLASQLGALRLWQSLESRHSTQACCCTSHTGVGGMQSLLPAHLRQVPSGLHVGVAIGQSALTLHAAHRPALVPESLQCGVVAERCAHTASSPAPLQARQEWPVASHTGKLAGQLAAVRHAWC